MAGKWIGKIKELDDMPFELNLRRNGDRITGSAYKMKVEKGEFRQGRLYFELTDEEDTYLLNGVVEQGKITGQWRSVKAKDEGEWTAERVKEPGLQSPDIVLLYEYRDKAGTLLYSTDQAVAGKPLCRVWRNPTTLLILDRDARPAQ